MIKLEQVVDVQPHPSSTNPMDVVIMSSGRKNVANRNEGEGPRYKVGDTAIVIPENYLLPEWLLKHNDLWNEEKGKGYLKGSKGNRTCIKNIAGEPSEVMLVKVDNTIEKDGETFCYFTDENDGPITFKLVENNEVIIPDVVIWKNPNK